MNNHQFWMVDGTVLDQLQANGQLALRYVPDENPNGAERNVAGLCDETGRVFGLMPHPERYLKGVQNPQWTRRVGTDGFDPELGDGLKIFKNAIDFFA